MSLSGFHRRTWDDHFKRRVHIKDFCNASWLHCKRSTVASQRNTQQLCICVTICPPSYVQVDPLVTFQVTFLGEAFATSQAAVRPLPGVDPAVGFEVAQLGEAATAERAAERPLTGVSLQMSLQVAGVWKALSALAAAQDVPGASVRVCVGYGAGRM